MSPPDHKTPTNVPVGTLCFLEDDDEHTILTATATDDSYTIRMSASNSSTSFDTLPDTLPPVPPRIMKHKKHLVLDTSLTSRVAPSPLGAFTQSSAMSFENNFVHSDSLKNASKTIASMRTTPPLLLPPPLKNVSVAKSVSAESEVCSLCSLLFHHLVSIIILVLGSTCFLKICFCRGQSFVVICRLIKLLIVSLISHRIQRIILFSWTRQTHHSSWKTSIR